MIQTSNRAALYARFSSDNQRSESIDAQIRAMTAYCSQRHIAIVETYVDEAKSAMTDRRPSFQRMVADSSHHDFNILLVHKLDRFARNRYDSAVYKRELKKNGVTVYSVLENLDNSPESIMMESVLEGMSEYYSQNLAREVMKGMRETALKCQHTGGKPPLGYDVDPVSHKLIVNNQEAEAVRLIFSMYSEGSGYSEILSALHEFGYKTKSGKEFMKNSLYNILTNPKYQGIYVFNRSSARSVSGTRNTHLLKDSEDIIAVDGGVPQIVDAETFSKVQERIDSHKHTGGRANAKTSYLLSGKVFCKECGRAMVGNGRLSGRNKARYITYRCPSKRYNCSNKEINQRYLEQYVITKLEEYIFNPAAMREIAKKIEALTNTRSEATDEERNKLQSSLAELNEAIGNITNVIMGGIVSVALTDKLAELEQEKARTETEIQRLERRETEDRKVTVDPLLIPQEYARLKDSPGSPAYKEFVQDFIERIEVGRYGLTITIRTGLDVCSSLDTVLTVRRQEVYEKSSSW